MEHILEYLFYGVIGIVTISLLYSVLQLLFTWIIAFLAGLIKVLTLVGFGALFIIGIEELQKQ